jgi:ribosome maturation factor RimP
LNLVIGGTINLANIEERVEKLLKDKIKEVGYELYDVEYAKEGKDYFLRIFIDKPEGIEIQDCEKVNDAINDILDEADYIKEAYYLEVSSPGIERILRKDKHLSQNIGNEIHIKLFQKDENGKKEYQGILSKFDGEQIELEDGTKVERKKIAQIKTIYNW